MTDVEKKKQIEEDAKEIALNSENTDLRKLRNGQGSSQYMISDYKWSEKATDSPSSVNSVQKLVITEFQPSPQYDYFKALGSLLDTAAYITGGQGGGGGGSAASAKGRVAQGITGAIKGLAKVGAQAATYAAEEALFKRYLQAPSTALKLPIQMLTNLFAGTWLKTFEVPWLEDKYLQAKPGDWSGGDAINKLANGDTISPVLNNTNMDVPIMPNWSAPTDKRTISTEFHLLNNTELDLRNNYNFLNAITAGALWMQMDIMRRPPNIYKVVAPGRFIMVWATMDIECTMVGKLRTNVTFASSVGANLNTLFPDAYKVKIQLTDLIPGINNYNTFLFFQQKQNEIVQVVTAGSKVGRENKLGITAAGTTAGNAAAGAVKPAWDAIKSGASSVGKFLRF